MKKPITLLLFFVLIVFQEVKSQTFCFTPTNSVNSEFDPASLRSVNVAESYCLRIYVHVIRRSDGTGGQTESEVNEALNFLDIDFNPHNIYFHWDGVIDYIDDNSYYSSPSTAIYSVNNHSDGIDIYLFDDSSAAGGRANGVGESSEFWVSGTFWNDPFGSLVKSHVISHEMGHVIFLWHTHHQEDIGCKEYVDGRNSDECGDFVDDTPPDPYLGFDVDFSDCQWNGSENDPSGVPYDPDETLIMSYSHIDCMNYFSEGQGQRMRNAIATLPHLTNAVVDCGDNCQLNINITENVTSGNTEIQHASESITASNIIESSATANYKAGQSVILSPGFHAEIGSAFTASIESCIESEPLINARTTENIRTDISKEIDELESWSKNLSAYPNPSSGKVNVVLDYIEGEEYQVAIYNSIGQLIKVENIGAMKSEISLYDLEEDIYFLRVYNLDIVIGTIRIIRQN